MGNQLFSNLFSSVSLSFFFIQTPLCHQLHHPKNIPDIGSGTDALTYNIFPSPDGDQSSPSHGNHTYRFCDTSEINSNTFNLLTCDILVCCYLHHQKKEMVSFLRERCLSLLHEAAPIVLWEMSSDKYPTKTKEWKETKIQILIEETPSSKRNIFLFKDGGYVEFLNQIIKTKLLNKCAIEKKKQIKGSSWQYLDKNMYNEFERKVLKQKKFVYDDLDEDDEDESDETDSEDDIATFEIQNQMGQIESQINLPPLQIPQNQAPPLPPGLLPPPPPLPPLGMQMMNSNLNGDVSRLKRIHWKNIEVSFLTGTIWNKEILQIENKSEYETRLQKELEEMFSTKPNEKKVIESKDISNIIDANRSRNIEIVLRGISKKLLKYSKQINHKADYSSRSNNVNNSENKNRKIDNCDKLEKIENSNSESENDNQSQDDSSHEDQSDITKIFPMIVEIITSGDENQIFTESECEALSKCLPYESDIKALKKYNRNNDFLIDNISIGDKWLLYCLKYPLLSDWLQSIYWMRNIHSEIDESKKLILIRKDALEQIRNSQLLKQMLHVILKIGKILNRGCHLENVNGFNLECLSKLSQITSTTRKYNLLDFIIDEMNHIHFPFEKFEMEMSLVEEASNIPLEMIDEKVKKIANCARFFQSLHETVLSNKKISEIKMIVMNGVDEISRQSGDMRMVQRDTIKFLAQKENEDILKLISEFITEVLKAYQKHETINKHMKYFEEIMENE